MDMNEFANTDRPWGFIAIPVSDRSLLTHTAKEVAETLAPKFHKEAKARGGVLVRGSFHTATEDELARLQIDQKDGYSTYICYMVK